jgi:hypothetical protein
LCLNPLHFSGVKRPSSGGTTLAVFGELCALVAVGWLQVACTQLTPKTASVVPLEDGRLTPETCRGIRHNKEMVKVYKVGYFIVIDGEI